MIAWPGRNGSVWSGSACNSPERQGRNGKVFIVDELIVRVDKIVIALGKITAIIQDHVEIMKELKLRIEALESERSSLKLRGLDETGL